MDPIRSGLAVLWALVALLAMANAKAARPGHWKLCAGLAGVLVSTAVWRWHAQLLKVAQRGLRQLGVYEDRLVLKVVIALVILMAAGLCVRLAKSKSMHSMRGSRLALFPCALAAAYLALLTLSLDDFMPWFLADPPGRFVTEYVLASLALGGALRAACANSFNPKLPHDHT